MPDRQKGEFRNSQPLGILPIDPTNQTSSNLYYSYNTNAIQYQLNAHFESQKYIPMEAASGGIDPATYSIGNNLSIAPWTGGMVGYWPLNEGSGTTAYDQSLIGNNGTWNGTVNGNGGTYYKAGNNQAYAGYFDGSTDYVSTTNIGLPIGSSAITELAWINLNSSQTNFYPTVYTLSGGSYASQLCTVSSGGFHIRPCVASSCYVDTRTFNTGQWVMIGFTFSGGNSGTVIPYLNGAAGSPFVGGVQNVTSPVSYIGKDPSAFLYAFSGLIDDVRVYNRALSASEIAAMYAAGR